FSTVGLGARPGADARKKRAGPGRPSEQAGSVLTAGHFQQVITELGLHRALHHVDRCAEHYGIEFLDHLAWAERAKVTTAAAGRAAGVVFGDLGEVSTAFDGGFQFVALVFAGNQDVTGSGAGHGSYSL